MFRVVNVCVCVVCVVLTQFSKASVSVFGFALGNIKLHMKESQVTQQFFLSPVKRDKY